MAHSHASKGQIVEIVNQLGNGRITSKLAQAIIDGRVEIIEKHREQSGSPCRGGPASDTHDLITIPNLSVAKLIVQAKEKLELTYLDEAGYKAHDFVTDEAGKTYEVLTWSPGRYVTTDEVRRHFADQKADGNTAAFVAWITEKNPMGWWISIPSDDARLFRSPKSGHLCAPGFGRIDDNRKLDLSRVDGSWNDGYSFVAFREVQV